jgi:hypothetical protein
MMRVLPKLILLAIVITAGWAGYYFLNASFWVGSVIAAVALFVTGWVAEVEDSDDERELIALRKLIEEQIVTLRTMDTAFVRGLPEHADRVVTRSWSRRIALSTYVEAVGAGETRVLVKAFVSTFPHMSSDTLADGFRITADGGIAGLVDVDRATLY